MSDQTPGSFHIFAYYWDTHIDGYMHWSKNFIDRGGSRIPLGGGANPPWEGANIQIFPKTA